MDQETLYQMSCRNGSKQARSSFMSSLGSVIAIDPEKDLGGYTNGVLIPFTFDVSANFSLPCRSGAQTGANPWIGDRTSSYKLQRGPHACLRGPTLKPHQTIASRSSARTFCWKASSSCASRA